MLKGVEPGGVSVSYEMANWSLTEAPAEDIVELVLRNFRGDDWNEAPDKLIATSMEG